MGVVDNPIYGERGILVHKVQSMIVFCKNKQDLIFTSLYAVNCFAEDIDMRSTVSLMSGGTPSTILPFLIAQTTSSGLGLPAYLPGHEVSHE